MSLDARPDDPALDEDASQPLWQQVLADLERRLSDGDITDRFPTDRELVEHYDVSRHTVRAAVRHLKARGVIERERGRGSFVRDVDLAQPLGTLYSLFRTVEEQGMTETSEVLRLGRRRDATAATHLGLEPDATLVHLERLRRAEGRPLALDTVWLPPEVGGPILDVDFAHTALYDQLADHAGVAVTAGRETITAVVPDGRARRVLEPDPDEALLRIERHGRTDDDRPVEYRVTLVRGSRFGLVSEWPQAGSVTPTVTPPPTP